jgi:hypothetical protein
VTGKRFSLGLIASLTVAGCAHNPGPPPSVNLSALSCAPSVSLEAPVALSFNPKKETVAALALDGSSKCLEEPSGAHSLYKLFALPEASDSYLIMVTATPWGDTILAPRLMFLDAEGAIKRVTAPSDFVFRGNNLSALLRSHPGETYMVVASDPQALGATVTRITDSTQSQMFGAGRAFFYVHTGSDTTANLSLLPAGSGMIVISALPAQ